MYIPRESSISARGRGGIIEGLGRSGGIKCKQQNSEGGPCWHRGQDADERRECPNDKPKSSGQSVQSSSSGTIGSDYQRKRQRESHGLEDNGQEKRMRPSSGAGRSDSVQQDVELRKLNKRDRWMLRLCFHCQEQGHARMDCPNLDKPKVDVPKTTLEVPIISQRPDTPPLPDIGSSFTSSYPNLEPSSSSFSRSEIGYSASARVEVEPIPHSTPLPSVVLLEIDANSDVSQLLESLALSGIDIIQSFQQEESVRVRREGCKRFVVLATREQANRFLEIDADVVVTRSRLLKRLG